MSNGARCCLLELCCSARADVVKAATTAGMDPTHLQTVLDWMAKEDLCFAPASMRAVIQDIAQTAWTHPKP